MQNTKRLKLIAALTAVPVLGAALAAGSLGARAAGEDCTVYFGGMDITRRNVPVLTIFNAQDVLSPLDLDITLRGADGTVLYTRENVITIGSFESGTVDLYQELIRDLPRRTRPYQGVCSLEVRSNSPAFAEANVILHVTDYFGSPKRARSALLFRPVWQETPEDV